VKALINHSQEITSLRRTKTPFPCSQEHVPGQRLKPAGSKSHHHIYYISPKCLQCTPCWHVWVVAGGPGGGEWFTPF
jgi:hypothetical protein